MMATWIKIHEGRTFEDVLRLRQEGVSGFDVLRLVLASLVLVWHARWIADLSLAAQPIVDAVQAHAATVPVDFWAKPWTYYAITSVHAALLPCFFAISGFLVLGSALRLQSVPVFLLHRVLRIFPALIVVVLLSVFVLGPLLTVMPLIEYFSAAGMYRYLANMTLVMGTELYLPGVFTHNPVTAEVNKNLWTLPAEFACYLMVGAMLLTRVIQRRMVLLVGMVIASVIFVLLPIWGIIAGPAKLVGFGYYFFAGALFYYYRHRIPVRSWWFVVCAVLSFLCLVHEDLLWLACLPLTYCTLYIGMLQFGNIPIVSRGDYSYGVYLYGFPISQLYLALFPAAQFDWVELTVLAGVTTLPVAMLSWHLVEKRALGMKDRLSARFMPAVSAI